MPKLRFLSAGELETPYYLNSSTVVAILAHRAKLNQSEQLV